MYRKRPRKILGSLAGKVLSLAVRFDDGPVTTAHKKLLQVRRKLGLLQLGLEYAGSPDDVFIVTYPKSGTTWLQMILYQLTTDGAMNFAHIDQVSPHLEETMLLRRQKISDLKGKLRVVKSHLPYHQIPKGPGRYIYGVRNGLDVAVSYHHHARKYLGQPNSTPGEFFTKFMAGKVPYGSWFEHVAGWLRNEDGLNVLVVTYEDLVADLEAGVKRIADFCGITIDPADLPRILERCSFAFMREHDAKFGIAERMIPKPPGPPTAFIRSGKVGGWQEELDAGAASEFQQACDSRLRDLNKDMFRVLTGKAAREGEPAR